MDHYFPKNRRKFFFSSSVEGNEPIGISVFKKFISPYLVP